MFWVRVHWLVCIAAFGGWTCEFRGQAEAPRKDPQEALRAALLDHELYLRNFDASRVMAWHWNGSALVPDAAPQLKTLGAFLPAHVAVKHDVVILEGVRRSLLREAGKVSLAERAVPLKFIVVVPHGEQAAVLPRLAEMLFFASREAAVAAIPVVYRTWLPGKVRDGATEDREKCDCADEGKPACEGRSASVGSTPPRLLSQADPEFSEEARHKKFSGDVGVLLTVNTTGHPEGLWLTRAAGLGLDEKAADAVRQYVFAPGVCHGEKVAVPLEVDVNFQIF